MSLYLTYCNLLLIIYTANSQSNDCNPPNTPGTTCVIDGSQDTLRCRDGDPCEINCGASDCAAAIFDAQDATDLTLTCSGTDACKGSDVEIYCGTGDCIIYCQNSATSCEDAVVINPNNRAHSFQCTGSCNKLGDGDTDTYTAEPTKAPVTSAPTLSPGSQSPTKTPTNYPSKTPSKTPTKYPTISPTKNPSESPTTPSKTPTKYPTISPTKYPTISPSKNPTINPSYSPSKTPTKYPTKYPTITPTQNPSNTPTSKPTQSPIPTKEPTRPPTNVGDTISPTKAPTKIPTITPTNSPSNLPTITPTNVPSIPPSYNPTNNPTNNPTRHDNGGEVGVDTTENNQNNNKDEAAANAGQTGLPIWIYILAACSAILCCLGFILLYRKVKHSNKRKESDGDAFRMQANTNMNDMDIWTNPVHHQTNHMIKIASVSGVGEGGLTAMVDDISSDEENGNQYTVPMTGVNDDDTPTVEMSDMNHRTREGPNEFGNDEFEVMSSEVLTPMTPNGDDVFNDNDIDNINNAQNEDNEVIQQIDNIMTPKGDSVDLITAGGDDDDIDGIDNINNNDDLDVMDDINSNIVTPKGYDDDDIDAINNNVENDELINGIDNIITAEGGDNDDNDVIDDNLAHEMQTPGGDDDSIIIDDINMDEDEDILDDDHEDFHETLQ